MKKTIKLKKNYEFKNTFKKGKYFSGKLLECFYLKNSKEKNYIGIAISSKLCNSVKRNRLRRVIKEAYRGQEDRINVGNTFVFLWNKKVEVSECNYRNVKEDMKKIFKKIGIYIDE